MVSTHATDKGRHRLQVRLTADERAQLREHAAFLGMGQSDVVRLALTAWFAALRTGRVMAEDELRNEGKL